MGALSIISLVHLAQACTTDHSILEKQPNSGGSGGSAGTGVAGSGGGAADAGLGGGSGGVLLDATADQFVEPPGDTAIQFVHGVVDATRVAFCFAKVVSGTPQSALGAPWPSAGLAYGGVVGAGALAGLDVATDDVLPWVIAASSSELSGKSCAELIALGTPPPPPDGGTVDGGMADAGATDAGSNDGGSNDGGDAGAVDAGLPVAPPVRALPLPMLPAGTLSGGYSTLLVATGCMGAPGFEHALDHLVCGADYAPDKPTLAPVLVRLSRVTSLSRVGLQFVHAALAGDDVSVTNVAPDGSSLPAFTFASGVVYGSIAPVPAFIGAGKANMGFPVGDPTLELYGLGSSAALLTVPWKNALAPGGLTALEDNENFAVVLVGPRPGFGLVQWWNPSGLTVVRSSPKL